MTLQKRFKSNRIMVVLLFAFIVSLTTGCKQNVGTWPPDKVAPIVAKSLEISDLSLVKTDAGMEGTGKRADGETMTVKVTQDSANNKFSWDAKGDRGSFEAGSYELK